MARRMLLGSAETGKVQEALHLQMEEQATLNAKLDEKITEVEVELAEAGPSMTPALQCAKDVLKLGWQLLAERQKFIKIVDHSKYE